MKQGLDPETQLKHLTNELLPYLCDRRCFLVFFLTVLTGDGQVDFNEFMTILGPKLLSSETREGFLGNTIDTIFWQVNHLFAQLIRLLKCKIQSAETCDQAVKSTQHLSRVLS